MSKLLEAIPSKVAISRDIIVAATPADLRMIPTLDKGERGIWNERLEVWELEPAQALITSHNTTFDFEAYSYISRNWPQTTGKFKNNYQTINIRDLI